MVFGVEKRGEYIDINVSDERNFNSNWQLCYKSFKDIPDNVDNLANDMHEVVVNEFKEMLEN